MSTIDKEYQLWNLRDYRDPIYLLNRLEFDFSTEDKYKQAIEYFKKFLVTYEREYFSVASHWNNLGNAYFSLGQVEKGDEYLEKGSSARDLNDQKNTWDSLDQIEKAIECYEKILANSLKIYGKP